MRVVVIGASGHIGTYLVPRLVGSGHEVVAMSRGRRQPYHSHPAWRQVEAVTVERDSDGFDERVAAYDADAVVDLICFTVDSARRLADALATAGTYLLHCGTLWVHGPGVEIPLREDAVRRPFGTYGTQKAAIEELLLGRARRGRLRATVLHPGHIVGPGWRPVSPRCLADVETFARLATGREVVLPDHGTETLHHVHADDVAQAFVRALDRPGAAIGEAFHVVSDQAVTLRGYAEAVATHFGQTARLSYLPWDQWQRPLSPEETATAWDHVARSPCASIDKARRLLGYQPRWSSLEAIVEALDWLVAAGQLDVGATGGDRGGPAELPRPA